MICPKFFWVQLKSEKQRFFVLCARERNLTADSDPGTNRKNYVRTEKLPTSSALWYVEYLLSGHYASIIAQAQVSKRALGAVNQALEDLLFCESSFK